ncbi:HNH endonuclease signature motif containing protein [Glycomyces artemisiae]|uniref:HNH endonuclease n=1 Tax=Glycomyces artemisiae TaxID=1076443 RepID=A0A2T0UWL6_9ACTN|nr:HNH endonuclease signature motif containing protein [Glycomyces artemisiae]PRY62310.1 HNH endonuclease [Glycomyces artemisiae]
MAATTIHSRTSSSDQAQTIRTLLDTAASVVNTQYAQVLSAVIDAKQANLHRTAFGFSALRDWLISTFDFTHRTAADIAAIARLSTKFRALVEAAVSGSARIDQVAYAVRQLDRTPAVRLFALTPFRTPVASPFDADTLCATPEHLIAQYCQHAPFKDLQRHLDELAAHLAEESELLDSLGQQSLQWIELAEQDNGMWALSGELSGDTGRLLDKYLKTACPPPRQDEQDLDGVLPAQPNRHAEALHQLLAGYGTSPDAARRHGHTATLDLTVDIDTLQGKDTGRTPLLEGQPISVAKARHLACEAGIIPGVFNYATGEAIELGRAARLPNQALRRKLELEQQGGCAWSGCSRPVAWTEAHHITHWADGGDTNADNLILLCRFHHGRIHTTGWSVEKTGPGQALASIRAARAKCRTRFTPHAKEPARHGPQSAPYCRRRKVRSTSPAGRGVGPWYDAAGKSSFLRTRRNGTAGGSGGRGLALPSKGHDFPRLSRRGPHRGEETRKPVRPILKERP